MTINTIYEKLIQGPNISYIYNTKLEKGLFIVRSSNNTIYMMDLENNDVVLTEEETLSEDWYFVTSEGIGDSENTKKHIVSAFIKYMCSLTDASYTIQSEAILTYISAKRKLDKILR